MGTLDKLIAISVLGMAVWLQGCFRCDSEQEEEGTKTPAVATKQLPPVSGSSTSMQNNQQPFSPESPTARNEAKEKTNRDKETKSKYDNRPIEIVPNRVYQLRSSVKPSSRGASFVNDVTTDPASVPEIPPLTKEEAEARGRFEANPKNAH